MKVVIIHGQAHKGVSNLPEIYAAQCLENTIILLGILVFGVIHQPEQNKAILPIVAIRNRWRKVIPVRVLISSLLLFASTVVFCLFLKLNHCIFDFWKFSFSVWISALLIGTVVFCTGFIFQNTVIGYLAGLLA